MPTSLFTAFIAWLKHPIWLELPPEAIDARIAAAKPKTEAEWEAMERKGGGS
jgi:hypothetical protein